MKKLLLLALIALSLSNAFCQIGQYNGKPRYQFIAVRNADTIGNFIVAMYPTIAPKHVRNFDSLVSIHFFDSTAFHRVIPGFVIQGGDPNSKNGPRNTWGFGDPSQQNVPAEFNPISHQRGVFSAARDNDPNSANSQFFVCVAAATNLDWNYTAYGKVTTGMNVVDNIVASPRDANDNPFDKIEMFVSRLSDDSTDLLAAPQIIAPAENAIGVSGNFNFAWAAQADAIMYEIELSRNLNMLPIDTVIKTTAAAIKIKSLEPGLQRYYWRLTSTNGGFKKSAPVQTFTTGEFPPSLTFPITGTVLQNNFSGFEWDSVPGVSTYRFQLATNPNFTVQSIVRVDSGLISPRFFAKNLQANKRHFWRVASEINGIPGDYSASFNFTTGAASVGIQNENAFGIKLFPNPATDYIFINSVEEIMELSLFDLQGKIIEITSKINGATAEVNIGRITSGIYVLRIKFASGNVYQTFQKD
jgi:peptidyl-prolyl cis-trans isomerase B (cyclophilin B)